MWCCAKLAVLALLSAEAVDLEADKSRRNTNKEEFVVAANGDAAASARPLMRSEAAHGADLRDDGPLPDKGPLGPLSPLPTQAPPGGEGSSVSGKVRPRTGPGRAGPAGRIGSISLSLGCGFVSNRSILYLRRGTLALLCCTSFFSEGSSSAFLASKRSSRLLLFCSLFQARRARLLRGECRVGFTFGAICESTEML